MMTRKLSVCARLAGIVLLALGSFTAWGQTIQNASFESQDANLDPIGWTEYGGAPADSDAHVYTPPTFGIHDAYDGARIYGIAQDGTRTGGGVYQQVSGATPGTVYRAQVWHYTVRTGDGEMRDRIGIDPHGGTDPDSANIVWSLPVNSDDQWSRIEIDATASASTITVFLQFMQSGSTGFAINYLDLVELIPNPPPPSPCTGGTASVTLSDRRVDYNDGNLEAQYTVPQGYVITGIGARGSAENVSTMVVEQAPMLSDGSLGQSETVRFGSEPDGPMEACILLPDCYVAVGYGVRAGGEFDIFTLAVWARPIQADGTLGALEEFRAGVEPDHALEKEFLSEPGRVLTGVGLGMSYSDINRIYGETDLYTATTMTTTVQTPPGFYQAGWNLTSVPVAPADPEASVVFQDLIALGNVLSNNLYRYDPGVGYAAYPLGFSNVDRGRGYWLWLDAAGGGTVVSVAGDVATENVVLPLAEGWNLVGHPFPEPVPLAACSVSDGATTLSFQEAAAAGWLAGGLYYWEPSGGYRLLGTAAYSHDDQLRPWLGYWICAHRPGLQLTVPAPT